MTYQQTKQWIVDGNVDNYPNDTQIQEVAEYIKNNQVVAFPTETVYGLGGNARSDQAIDKIFQAKGRPSDNPLIVHISSKSQLAEYVENITDNAKQLIEAFWPGPLTIVLPHNGKLSPKVTAGLSTVAVRMPDHPVALAIIEAAGLPIAAPSANRSGRPSPTTAAHVTQDLDGKIAGVVDGGATGVGVESTVVDCTTEKVMILRPGGITKEALEQVVGEVLQDPALTEEEEAPKSPGMKYTHYAPSAPLILVDGDINFLRKNVLASKQEGKRVGTLLTQEHQGLSEADKEVIIGSKEYLPEVARALYEALRGFEANEVDIIYSEVFPETDLGSAIMNRLRKAAGGKILQQK
ncbi:threonylcarbamoyl-AMP synthase [Salipaludibacillus neizhouensis]|uniref:Threonylcarbamoyl-AMP synthase n=1 Tax=Salipaludibacillus neizhouensis TaxID=885475 RepID=A0A3A9KED7_9BACI|nr:L-threonylcarbamoyladenylate synthase [Salipaludibacillus neizhouensis]RKL67993.1 threonylcarbamoyl-AMP synthase [Salipaludibacillus neizhouensis]